MKNKLLLFVLFLLVGTSMHAQSVATEQMDERFNDGTKLRIPIGPFVRQGFIELGRMLNGH